MLLIHLQRTPKVGNVFFHHITGMCVSSLVADKFRNTCHQQDCIVVLVEKLKKCNFSQDRVIYTNFELSLRKKNHENSINTFSVKTESLKKNV